MGSPQLSQTCLCGHLYIEYIVEDTQGQTGYQTQEVCETMEGEVILEDGRQLKVEGKNI
jgi:hypothetical protein